MATLAESFLADLNDLDDDVEEEPQAQAQEEGDEEMLGDDLDNLNYDSLEAVAHLTQSERYRTIMEGVRQATAAAAAGEGPPTTWTGPSEEDPTYKLLVDCNQLAVDIDNEITIVYNFIRDKYRRPKFPELESLVHHPLDYARVVQLIGNEMDVTELDLERLLPPATVMVVTVTATTTSGKPLSGEDLGKAMAGCEMALQLEADKAAILGLVQQQMDRIAPNLSAAVGTEIAAQMMGVAGGLLNLSKMPACNVQVLGAKRRNLAGFSSAAAQPHQGFIFASDLIQQTPPSLRAKAARLVGAMCTLLARMDAYGEDPSGAGGAAMREEMRKKIEKWQEPPPAKTAKVLPVPDAEVKKRRGGKRFRKMKERYGMTELKKQANRMMFNKAEEEFIDGEDTIGLGVIGKEGSGRLRALAAQQRQKLGAKGQKKYALKNYGSSGATSGLSSSLAFTPIQGIELVNPSQAGGDDALRSGTESYFSEYSGFRSQKKAAG